MQSGFNTSLSNGYNQLKAENDLDVPNMKDVIEEDNIDKDLVSNPGVELDPAEEPDDELDDDPEEVPLEKTEEEDEEIEESAKPATVDVEPYVVCGHHLRPN